MTDNGNNTITVRLPRLPRDERIPDFPRSAYRGWAGKFASVHSRVCEAPKPFFYASALTYIGAILGRRLKYTRRLLLPMRLCRDHSALTPHPALALIREIMAPNADVGAKLQSGRCRSVTPG